MEFRIEKCARLIIKKKKKTTRGFEFPNQKNIKTLLEKEKFKFLLILEVDTVRDERKRRG